MERDENNISMLDIIKFEIKCVRGNILMSPADKNEKIKELKKLVPGCKDWEGLDSFIENKKFIPRYI